MLRIYLVIRTQAATHHDIYGVITPDRTILHWMINCALVSIKNAFRELFLLFPQLSLICLVKIELSEKQKIEFCVRF